MRRCAQTSLRRVNPEDDQVSAKSGGDFHDLFRFWPLLDPALRLAP
jgi:hypothetical protein